MHTVTELRRANLLNRKLETPEGRRLFWCLLDFELAPELFAAALQAPQHSPCHLLGVSHTECVVPGAWCAIGNLKRLGYD